MARQAFMTVLLVAGFLSVMAAAVSVRAQTAGFAPADQQEFNSRFAGHRVTAEADDGFRSFLEFGASGRFVDSEGDSGTMDYRRTGPNTGRVSSDFDDPIISSCALDLTFISANHGTFAEVAGSNPFLTCNLGGTWRIEDPDEVDDDTSTPVEPAGFAPADQQAFNRRFAGRQIAVGGNEYYDVQANGRFRYNPDGTTGTFVYDRTGANTASVGLDDFGNLGDACSVDITFTSTTSGTWRWTGSHADCNSGGGTWRTERGTTAPETEEQTVIDIVRTVAAATVANVASNIGTRFSAARSGRTVTSRSLDVTLGSIPATPSSLASGVAERGGSLPGDIDPLDEGGSFTLADLLNGSAFETPLNAAADGTQGAGGVPQWTLWGRGDLQLFDSDPDRGSSYDGDLRAGYLGIESRRGDRWLAGVAMSLTRAEADYALTSGPHKDGRLEMSLASVHPYLRYAPDAGSEFWGLLGAGQGEIEIGGSGATALEKSDLTMWMGSAGARRALAPVGALDLALLGDVGIARVETDDTLRVIDRLETQVWRARVGVEGSLARALESGGTLTPFMEVAARYDGGDGEREVGLEVAPGLFLTNPDGSFSVEARGHVLALHSADNYSEYGASMTVSLSPRSDGLGLSLSVSPRWGTGTGDVYAPVDAGALWRDDQFRRPDTGSVVRRAMSLDARAGYGIRAMRGVLTPFGEFGLREEGSRWARLGMRFGRPLSAANTLGVELSGERFESDGAAPDHRLRLTGRLNF